MAKVLFQSTNPATFRSTSIGYLYEVAQEHEVVLLTEKLDSYTEKVLSDRSLFPGLEKVILFESPFHGNIFTKNYRLRTIMKKTIGTYRPDIVVSHTDTWPAEMYAMRFAKKNAATTVAIQSGFRIAGQHNLLLWSSLMNAQNKMPKFLPFSVRMFLVKLKKLTGYVLYHWILPLLAREMPFFGKTSFVFWHDSPGLRDADYSVVFSKRDAEICVQDGVSPKKIRILGHPLEHKATKRFFEKSYFSKNKEMKNQKTLTIMWSDDKIGFTEENHALIPEEKMQENRVRVVKLISEKLADWNIIIKPHPSIKSTSTIKEFLGEIAENVFIANPADPADMYIERSSCIVGMPPPSTTLFTAVKQDPEKIVLSLNLNNEFVGDSYKNFEGIEYIDSEGKFIEILSAIKNNTYKKERSIAVEFDFSDAGKLIQHLYDKRIY